MAGALVPALVLGVLLSACGGDPEDSDDAGSTSSATPSETASEAISGVDTLIAAGLEQVAANDLDTAVGTFESVLTLDPGNVYGSYNLGYIAQLRDQRDRAETYYEEALAAQDDFAPALYNLALLSESDDLDAAIELYRRAVAASPEDAASYMRLGFALQQQGQDEEGQEFLDRGIALDPSMAAVDRPTYD